MPRAMFKYTLGVNKGFTRWSVHPENPQNIKGLNLYGEEEFA